MKKLIILSAIALALLGLSSCGEFNKAQKSHDYDFKYDYAKRAYANRQFTHAATILQSCVQEFRGRPRQEEALYLLAMCNYENRDYTSAGTYFKEYYTKYPKGKYAEASRFYTGYGYYLDSPEPQLDQTTTLKAIEELQTFLDYFPKSDKVAIAQNAIFELQDKLTLKQLENANLYYNLGNYMGNNYESAVIVAKNAIKDYPYSKYKEDLEMLVLKARYQEAKESIDEKKVDRFRVVLDEYYSFVNNYPDSKNREEAENIFKVASRYASEE